MTCDIETGLMAVADAIRNFPCCAGGGGSGGIYDVVNPLPNETILGPDPVDQGNPQVDPVPEGFATWAEYFQYKCQAAHFIWELERKHLVALRNFEGIALTASVAGPVLAGLAGILPAAFTPAGGLVFLTCCLAIAWTAAFSWYYVDEMLSAWDFNKEDIVCALYNSGTSGEAVSVLANAVEDAIQSIVSWGVLAPVSGTISGLLSTAFAQTANNGFVEPLFKSIAAVVSIGEVDCNDCEGPTGSYGCFTFVAGLMGQTNYGCGSVSYDPFTGHDGAGSCNIEMPNACFSEGLQMDYWNGLEVHEGDIVSAWFLVFESSDSLNIAIDVVFTDESGQSDFVIVTESPEWQYVELAINAQNDGKTIDFLRVFIQKSLNMETRRAKIDDVCVTQG